MYKAPRRRGIRDPPKQSRRWQNVSIPPLTSTAPYQTTNSSRFPTRMWHRNHNHRWPITPVLILNDVNSGESSIIRLKCFLGMTPHGKSKVTAAQCTPYLMQVPTRMQPCVIKIGAEYLPLSSHNIRQPASCHCGVLAEIKICSVCN